MRIVWDEPKRLANRDKHGIDLADIDEGFFLGALVGPARQGRYFAIGELDGVIVVMFAVLGEKASRSSPPARRAARNGDCSDDPAKVYTGRLGCGVG